MPVIPSDAEDVKVDETPSVTDETVGEPVAVGIKEPSVDVAVVAGAVPAPEPEKLTPVAVSDTELEIVLLRSEVELASEEELTMPLGPNVIPVDDGGSEEADVVGTGTTSRTPLVVGRTITPGRPPVDATLLASELLAG